MNATGDFFWVSQVADGMTFQQTIEEYQIDGPLSAFEWIEFNEKLFKTRACCSEFSGLNFHKWRDYAPMVMRVR